MSEGYRTMSAHTGVHRWFRELVWPHPGAFMMLARAGVVAGIPADYHAGAFDLNLAGYPRSGNTFISALLRMTQPEGFRVASHSHCVPLIRWLVGKQVPTCFLIRRPEQAAVSWAICQSCSLEEALDFYIFFHRKLIDLREQLVVSPFEVTTKDFARVLRDRRLRGVPGLRGNFDQKSLTSAVLEEVERDDLAQGKTAAMVARPLTSREVRRTEIEAGLSSRQNQRRLALATELYEHFCEGAIFPDETGG